MIIHQVQSTFSKEHGGPTHSLRNFCIGLASLGHEVHASVLEGFPNTSPVELMPPPVITHVFPLGFPSVLGRSSVLSQNLRERTSPDLYYLHGVWHLATHYAAQEAQRRNIPYIIELMGMYERYPLSVKPCRKSFFRWLFQDRDLHHSACLQVNSAQEGRDLRDLGFKNPIAVVPVGVRIPGGSDGGQEKSMTPWPQLGAGRFFLFLSRIHPKKGIELLLNAWAGLHQDFPDHTLLICGSGSPEYVTQCHRLATELGLDGRCHWTGPVTEAEKDWAYENASFYVLPSFSENYGNTVAESLAHGTPVLVTDQTPWHEIVSRKCGWLASPTIISLKAELRVALSTGHEELKMMGHTGLQWASAEFSLSSVIHKLDETCRWVKEGGERPGFFLD